jgi:hypothetical protein
MARRIDDPVADQLKKLAQTEASAARQRLAKRTTAARDFASATAMRAEGAATWERIQGEANLRQAKAIAALLDSDLKPTEVAQLLGINVREVRALKSAAPQAAPADNNATAHDDSNQVETAADTIAT